MKKITIFFIAVIFLYSCKDDSKKITLEPKFKAGDVYTLDYGIDMDQTVMSMKNNIQMKVGYKLNIKDADAVNGYNIDMGFNRISMNMKTPSMTIAYDSDNKNENANSEDSSSGIGGMMNKMMGTMFGGMLNKSIMVKMSPQGEVKEVTGFKEIMQAVIDSAETATPLKREDIEKSMGGTMNEAQIRNTFQQVFSIYPQKPVSVGETWVREVTTTQGNLPMKVTSTYKVAEIIEKDNEVILDVTGKINSTGDGEITQSGMTMKMQIDGTQSGKITVDTKTGFIKQGKITHDMKASVETMGQKVPMDMKLVMTIVGKKI